MLATIAPSMRSYASAHSTTRRPFISILTNGWSVASDQVRCEEPHNSDQPDEWRSILKALDSL
jgi:hypothetical protein